VAKSKSKDDKASKIAKISKKKRSASAKKKTRKKKGGAVSAENTVIAKGIS
jgi:hypothetical protein